MIILICGLSGSGKTFIANEISEKYGCDKMSFAAQVKSITAQLYDLPLHMLSGHTPISRNWREISHPNVEAIHGRETTPRDAIINIAEPLRESHNLWAKLLANKIYMMSVATGKLPNVVIDDMRFSEEHQHFESTFGRENIVVIKVERNTRGLQPNHVSETSHKNIIPDFTYHNGGNMGALLSFMNTVLPCV